MASTACGFGHPLPQFEEFEQLQNQVIYVSATPAEYELQRSEGIVAEQLIRLRDCSISRSVLRESGGRPARGDPKTLRDRRACSRDHPDQTHGGSTHQIPHPIWCALPLHPFRCGHSERVEIKCDLRLGLFDVLIGVNLLREGLDLPEVLVATSGRRQRGLLALLERSLVQTIGRAARTSTVRPSCMPRRSQTA